MSERAAGGVVWRQTEAGNWVVLLIRDKHDCWTLPKGHMQGDESEAQAARREVAEETGVDCTIGPLLERITYPVHKKKGWRLKTVAYFLATAHTTALVAAADEGISAVEWYSLNDALDIIGYAQIREIVRQAYDDMMRSVK